MIPALALSEALQRARFGALSPPPVLSLSSWAATHARLPAGSNAMPGRFEAFGYQKGWLDAITDPTVRQVTVMKSARVGYTRVLDHAVGYFIHQDPSSILMVLPRVEDCEDFSRSEILPMLTDTPVLAEITGDIKSRDANQRILKRTFRNGASVAFVGANSPAGFRRISARIILFDETDGYPAEAGFEGDQISLGIKRAETFWNRKIVLGSTPLLKYQSRIEKAFNESDQRRYHVPCPQCGHFQTLRWENLRWDKTPDGKHLPATAHFVCEKNGCIVPEHNKSGMIAAGRWIAERPFNGHAGFALWAAYSLFPNASWSNIVSEFLVACKDPILLRTFCNITKGEPWEERGSGRPWEELAARARSSNYKRGEVPKGALLLFLGVDVQIDRVEWQLVGRGPEHRRYVVDYGTIGFPITEADCQRALDALLNRHWPNYCGLQQKLTLAAIDAGFETDTVLEYCRRWGPNKIIAVRGVAGDYTPRIAKVRRERDAKRGTLLRRQQNLFNVGTHTLKNGLYQDLAKDDPNASGYISFPSDAEDRFFQELCSEQRVAVKKMGQVVFRWEKISDRQPNEMLDCFCYASSAMSKYGCTWISDDRWQELEAQCAGIPSPTPPKKSSHRCWPATEDTNMGGVSVFHLHLVCGRHRINLICHRMFNGDYILEGDEFRASIAVSEARDLATAGRNLCKRADTAKNGVMKPGPVFERELPVGGILEFGVVPTGLALYMNLADTHVVFDDEQQVWNLEFALRRLGDDVALTTLGNALGLAQTPGHGPIQSNVVPSLRGPELATPDWARDEKW